MSEATTEDIRNMVRIVTEVSSNSLEALNDDFTRKLVADVIRKKNEDKKNKKKAKDAFDELGLGK